MNKAALLNFLAESKLFKNISINLLEEMSTHFNFQKYQRNAIVFNQGDFGEKLYFILEGKVEVFVVNKNGEKQIINHLHPGDYFGELALLVDSTRSASIKCISSCSLCWIERKVFQSFLDNHPNISRELLIVMSERLADTLHILAKRGKKINVLMNYQTDQRRCMEHFIAYFKKISPHDVIVLDSVDLAKVLSENQISNRNVYLLIKNDLSRNVIFSQQSNYIINFDFSLKTGYSIATNASDWQIEHLARVILKKTIGIALSSGGAPAMAHIGILRAFKDASIPLDYIVGTSAGAIYGAMAAFDLPLDQLLTSFSKEIDKPKWLTLLKNLSYNFSGMMSSNHLKKMISPFFDRKNIEDANIPFAAVASDLLSGKTIAIKHGPVIDALLASNSAPVVVEPFHYENYLLIDGAATAPLPIHILSEENIDFKIAVPIPQLDLVVSFNRHPTFANIYARSRSMMANELENYSLNLADLIIQPEIENARVFDWHKREKYIECGKNCAKKAIPDIKRFLERKAS